MSEPNGKARKLCPICGRETAERYKPFCSARCADIDLNRWLKETYRVPATEGSEEEVPSSQEQGERE